MAVFALRAGDRPWLFVLWLNPPLMKIPFPLLAPCQFLHWAASPRPACAPAPRTMSRARARNRRGRPQPFFPLPATRRHHLDGPGRLTTLTGGVRRFTRSTPANWRTRARGSKIPEIPESLRHAGGRPHGAEVQSSSAGWLLELPAFCSAWSPISWLHYDGCGKQQILAFH